MIMAKDWKLIKLKDTSLTIIDGDRGNNYPKSDDFTNDGYCLFLSAKNITKNGFRLDEKQFISKEKDNLLRKGKLKKFDIIITTRGSVGHIAFNKNIKYKNMRINSGMVILRNNDDIINQNYIYKLFASNVIQRQIEKIAFGSAQPQLTVKEINNLKIPLPPLKEQEKIADILSTADEKIDAIASQIQKAQTLKKGLLQKLLSEGIGHSEFKDSELGKIPESWDVVELEKLLTFKNGVNASKEQYGKGYRFINVLDIINNLTIKHDDIIGLVDIPEKEFELYEVKYGDILFQRSSETRAEVGQSNVYLDKEQSATFGGFVIKGSAKQEYNPIFMNYLFKIPAIRKQITSKSGGSTRYNIGQSSLNQVVVQLPSINEQKQIADILSTADEKVEVLRAKKEKYEILKIGLLQKLLSGEIRC